MCNPFEYVFLRSQYLSVVIVVADKGVVLVGVKLAYATTNQEYQGDAAKPPCG